MLTFLKPGDKIAVVSPSGPLDESYINSGVALYRSWGYDLDVLPNAKNVHQCFAGTDEQRLADFQFALDCTEYKAIVATRGGYGAVHLLTKLDWTTFKQNPKWIIGFSDITNFLACCQSFGIPSLHAPMLKNCDNPLQQPAFEALKMLLAGQSITLKCFNIFDRTDGVIEAGIVGGNLATLIGLRGTTYEPDYEGKILFLEDIGEELYRVDRMLHNLYLGGVFGKISALVVGSFSQMTDPEPGFGKSLDEIIWELTDEYKLPVAFGAKIGHGDVNFPLVMGKKVTLTIADEFCTINQSLA